TSLGACGLMRAGRPRIRKVPTWVVPIAALGLYLTLAGYHSLDGDQAYRLPLLLRCRDPALYVNDPFVRSFDVFNPHFGSLALVDSASRPLGLSWALAGLFALTFGATFTAIERLSRACWPGTGRLVGYVGVGLFFLTRAGNIGTNHLF